LLNKTSAVTSFIESDLNICKPASRSWGGIGDPFSMYVTNLEDASDKFSPPDPAPNPADVVKFDFCWPGKQCSRDDHSPVSVLQEITCPGCSQNRATR
jgi:hypothetical protein